MIKYPETLVDVGRADQVLAADSKIQPLDAMDFASGKSPLQAYKPWSGLRLNFADSSKGIGGSGSIEVNHLADVRMRTQIAMHAVMEMEMKKSKAEFRQGKTKIDDLLDTKVYFLPKEITADYRGKTALEIARGNGYSASMIAVQNLKNSAANNPKYAKNNLKQAQAMEMAAAIIAGEATKLDNGQTVSECFCADPSRAMQLGNELYRAGHPAGAAMAAFYQALQKEPALLDFLKQEKTEGEKKGRYQIYGPVLKTPNIEKLDKDGYTKAYSLSVYCDPKQLPYPFKIELQTMRGKPMNDRSVGVIGETIVDRKDFSISLQTWEWLNIIERADWEAKLVALWAHNEQYAASVAATQENRAAGSQKNQPAQSYGQPYQAPVQTNSYYQAQPGYQQPYVQGNFARQTQYR